MSKKQRLDVIVYERGLAPSRAKAQALIMAGDVFVDGNRIDKAGTRFGDDIDIMVRAQPPFVSRGGEKLAWALEVFQIETANKVAADVGASTGGFTDCLLQNGIGKVYAIDVGYGQLAHKLRIDERVVVMERTNARYLETLAEPIDLAVIDASFISLKLLLPQVKLWMKTQGDVIALIKPQFEAGKSQVGKGGVVKDQSVHQEILHEILSSSIQIGFKVAGLTTSPIKGLKEGNTEFLVWLTHGQQVTYPNLDELVSTVLLNSEE